MEADERFSTGQSLYKIGRDMKRSQASIRGHLINLGLIEYAPEPVVYESNFSIFSSIINTTDLIILSILLIVLPSLGLMYMGLLVIKSF